MIPTQSRREVGDDDSQDDAVNSRYSPPPTKRGMSAWRVIGILFVFAVLGVVGIVGGKLVRILKPKAGEVGAGKSSIIEQIKGATQVGFDPKAGFPGMDKITICCMGIDDNWTNSDIEFTKDSRTDTLFLMTMDLVNKKITVLSIPRDTYVPIAGTKYSSKINSAYATGGPARTDATVSNWLGVSPDYYIVLNIDATKRMVDALGGVDVNVEHAMDYDDTWGHLHVHLQPGFQHLDGDLAVSFARFRHSNHGVTPEDGDERRMYRQHILLKAMIEKGKNFSNIAQADNLVDIGMSCIHTNLTRTQLFDLANIFHDVNPDTDVTTASLVGEDARGPHGAYVMEVDQDKAKKYADWLVRGDEGAARGLTSVLVMNTTTTSGLAAKAVDELHSEGYTLAHVSSSKAAPLSQTAIVDSGVADHDAAKEIAQLLGVPNAPVTHNAPKPNHLGWTPPVAIKVEIGSDYAPSPHTTNTASAAGG